jgi:hypothetical protein
MLPRERQLQPECAIKGYGTTILIAAYARPMVAEVDMMSQAPLDTWASWFVFGGGFMVLWGSFRQAKAELAKYRDLATEADKEKIKDLWLGRLVSGSVKTTATGRALKAFAVGFLAFARQRLQDRDVRREAKDALNSATAWGLILLGSFAATVAAAVQVITLSFPHI